MRRLLFSLLPIFGSALPYEINFVGLKDEAVLKAMFDVSQLVTLQDRPPASINGIRYRAASDVPNLLKVLRAYAYYDASITYDVENEKDGVQVYMFIHPGTQYKLASYDVYHGAECAQLAIVPDCAPFTPDRLGLTIGKPALSTSIVNAELSLLTELARCGYPLAAVEKRRVEVDMKDKEVRAASCIEEGELSHFGPITVYGLKNVKPRYVLRKVAWKEGEIYNPDDVQETQRRLLNSDLFSSVLISHGEKLDEHGELPMKMRISEANHRQVSIGAFYATVDGPGASIAWTHRNVRGMGEIVSIDGEFSKRYLAGTFTYKKPDFLRLDQSYRVLAEINREDIRPYIAFTYRGANFIDRKIDARRSFSAGLRVEHVNIARSASNGTYLLIALPLFMKYNTAENQLDPTSGYSIVYQVIPFQSLWHSAQHFFKQRVTGTVYIPFTQAKKFVLALRAQVGSIAGTSQQNVPMSELFLGGSEDDLRGYQYKTVSPLNAAGKPLGGRSAIFTTAEARMRFTQTIGIVAFSDFGTVSLDEVPNGKGKWFTSVGCGLRYFAFFGPLRLDVGFPLDRRKGIDPSFRLYASIGQTF